MSRKNDNNRRNRHRRFWENICLEFYERLNVYARRLANGKDYDAADLVQETVVRVLFYSPNPKKIRNPLSYALTVMRHVWTDKWRDERAAETDSLDQLREAQMLVEPAVEPDILRILENEELLEQMNKRRGPLTPREDLLLMKHLEGYSCGEIASHLDEDKRATRADLNAVRVKVKQRLQQKGDR